MLKTGSKSLDKIKLAYDVLENIDFGGNTRERERPMSDESMDMIETEYEVTIFSTGKELYSAVDTLYENNNSLVYENQLVSWIVDLQL